MLNNNELKKNNQILKENVKFLINKIKSYKSNKVCVQVKEYEEKIESLIQEINTYKNSIKLLEQKCKALKTDNIELKKLIKIKVTKSSNSLNIKNFLMKNNNKFKCIKSLKNLKNISSKFNTFINFPTQTLRGFRNNIIDNSVNNTIDTNIIPWLEYKFNNNTSKGKERYNTDKINNNSCLIDNQKDINKTIINNKIKVLRLNDRKQKYMNKIKKYDNSKKIFFQVPKPKKYLNNSVEILEQVNLTQRQIN